MHAAAASSTSRGVSAQTFEVSTKGISARTRASSVLSCSELIKFRRQHPLLGRKDFLSPQDITWHEDNWDNPESKFLAFSLHDRYL